MCFGNWKTIFQWIYQKDSTHQCFCISPQQCAQKNSFKKWFIKQFNFMKLALEVIAFKYYTFFPDYRPLCQCTWYQSTFSHVFQFSLLSCNLSNITMVVLLYFDETQNVNVNLLISACRLTCTLKMTKFRIYITFRILSK